MKASLKFRDDQKALIRAKIPLNFLGFPFQSGVVAGESSELTLSLSTAFDSGPSLRLSYRPNDPSNPFSLSVRSGSGPFGSPLSSSFSISAHFNLLHHRSSASPVFALNFCPSFGDLSVKKRVRSSNVNPRLRKVNGGASGDEDPSIEVVENPNGGGVFGIDGIGSFRDFGINVADVPTSVAGLLSGMEVGARTKVPVVGRAAIVSFRWGVKVPVESRPFDSSNFRKFPFLVMNKIGIEHVKGCESKVLREGCNAIDNAVENADRKLGGTSGNFADSWYWMRRQLEILKEENGELRSAMEDLRCEFASKRRVLYGEAGSSGSGKPERRIRYPNKNLSSDTSVGYMGNQMAGDAREKSRKGWNGGNGA